jgi:hypothetical protein
MLNLNPPQSSGANTATFGSLFSSIANIIGSTLQSQPPALQCTKLPPSTQPLPASGGLEGMISSFAEALKGLLSIVEKLVTSIISGTGGAQSAGQPAGDAADAPSAGTQSTRQTAVSNEDANAAPATKNTKKQKTASKSKIGDLFQNVSGIISLFFPVAGMATGVTGSLISSK